MRKLFSVILSLTLIISPVAVGAEDASKQFLENPDAEKKGSMAKTLVVMATSSLGAGAPVGCAMGGMIAPSSMVFTAGSLIYLLGEMNTGKSRNSSLKKRAEDMKLSQEKLKAGGDTQRVALEEALKEQKDLLAFLEKRSGYMNAVKLAWMAAAGVAIGEALGFTLFTMNCAGAGPAAVPWIAGLSIAYQLMIGIKSGELLSVLLAPVVLGVTLFFIPMKSLPVTRAALYSGAALAAGSVASDLSEKKKVIQNNISMLEATLNQFNQETLASDSSNLPGADESSRAFQTEIARSNTGTAVRSGSTAAGTVSNLPGADAASAAFLEKTCAVGQGENVKIGSDCTNPIQLKSSGVFSDIPELQAAALNSVQTANSMASGNSVAGANISDASLASSAGRIKEINEGLMKRLNDKLAREGKPKVDLDIEAKKALDGMTASIMGEIDKGGAPLLASLEPALGTSPSAATPAVFEKGNSPVPVQAAVPAPSFPAVIETLPTEKPTEFSATTVKADSLENYEVNTEDVSKNKETSIWEQVTTRYQMNYGRFFERKKPETVQP